MRPSKTLLIVFFTLALCTLLAQMTTQWNFPLAEEVLLTSKIILVAFFITTIIDAWHCKKISKPTISRQLPKQAAVGQSISVEYQVKHHLSFASNITIYDGYPIGWLREYEPLPLQLAPQKISSTLQSLTPNRRGIAQFTTCQSLVTSPWKLWQQSFRHDFDDQIKVLPDFTKILGADLLSLNQWLQLIGIKRSARHGSSMNFHQLREFQQGDDIRHIDWKASSKHQNLISKTFEAEHDQQLIFLLDCGREMRISDDELTHFDHALNAIMLLSYTAIRHQDAVGLMTFSHPNPRFVPAKKNQNQLNQLLEMVYDIEPSQQAPDYALAVNNLLKHQPRRSLVIVITHITENNDPDMMSQIKLLSRHHTVLLVNLQQQQQHASLSTEIESLTDAYLYTGAQMYQHSQSNLTQDMQTQKIAYANVLPKELSTTLINHYLSIKQNGTW